MRLCKRRRLSSLAPMIVKCVERCSIKVLVEDDVVIVLRHKTFKSEVLRHKADKFGAGPVISQLVG